MLAVQARAFNSYFYLTSTNANQPPRFLPHKLSGILFENKVDCTTYFGDAPHLVHGIHMLPLAPPSAYLRPRAFVKEEWDAFFAPQVQVQGQAQASSPSAAHPPASSSPSTPPAHSTIPFRRLPSTDLHPSTPPAVASRPAWPYLARVGVGGPYVDGGWRGILFANLALVDAKAAYGFFREGVEGVWDERWVDGGATRSWYLVWCAGLGGVGGR